MKCKRILGIYHKETLQKDTIKETLLKDIIGGHY